MGIYRDVILPKLCDLSMRNERLRPYRERVIGAAQGRVLEIGVGSGLNLPFYGPAVGEVLALEPSAGLVAMAREAPRPDLPVSFIDASAEAIPLDDKSVDGVVDALHDSGRRRGADGNAPRTQTWRKTAVC
nr:methyltransferase domain-containing protein [Sinorhizobium meliloti]